MSANEQLDVAIVVFDDVEVLDVCGPFEVFSVAGFVEDRKPFSVRLVAAENNTVHARNGLKLLPDCTYSDCPVPDILVVPGGPGARPQSRDPHLLTFLQQMAPQVRTVLSVCTGALIMGRAGLLDNQPATTHHRAIQELQDAAPSAQIQTQVRYVRSGNMVLSGGVAAGIDAALEVVADYCGPELAKSTAHYMEFPWNRNGEAY